MVSNLTENGFQGAGIGNIQEFAAQRTQKDFSNNELNTFKCNSLFCKVSKLDLDRGYLHWWPIIRTCNGYEFRVTRIDNLNRGNDSWIERVIYYCDTIYAYSYVPLQSEKVYHKEL